MSSPPPTIDTLLRLTADPSGPTHVLTTLSSDPSIASASDSTGYTLLHAAASYSQLFLLRELVNTYHVDPNITDSEGETPLFAAETVDAARCLVEELGANVRHESAEGVTPAENAKENVDDGGEWVRVAEYLATKAAETPSSITNGTAAASTTTDGMAPNEDSSGHPPPPLPEGVRITGMRSLPASEQEGNEEPDPEFRRRIEELAAREDFQGEEGQAELKRLIEDAVGGLREGALEEAEGRDVRRRMG